MIKKTGINGDVEMIFRSFLKELTIFSLIIIFVSGCAATGPSYRSLKTNIPQLKAEKVRLYFMRDTGFMASATNAPIQVNGKTKPGLAMGGFFYTDESPGNIVIKIDAGAFDPGSAKLTLKAQAGHTYYFFVEPNTDYIMTGSLFGVLGRASRDDGPYKFYQISKKMALEKLKTKKLSN